MLTADLDALEVAWATNLLGPWRLIQTVTPWLRHSANPRIVNVASGSGPHGERAEQVHDGISADDHAAGLASSLANLAAYVQPHGRSRLE